MLIERLVYKNKTCYSQCIKISYHNFTLPELLFFYRRGYFGNNLHSHDLDLWEPNLDVATSKVIDASYPLSLNATNGPQVNGGSRNRLWSVLS